MLAIVLTMAPLETVVEELKALPLEKQEIAAKVIHALTVEAGDEYIHPEWKAIIDERTREIEEGNIKLDTAEEVEAYVVNALKDFKNAG